MVTIITVPELLPEINRRITQLRTALPEWTGDVSDPLYYVVAERVQNLINELETLNSSAKQLIIATATGDDLDELMSNYNLTCNAGESDADLRARLPRQFQALSKDTESYVKVQALSQAGVSDVAITLGVFG